MGGLGSGGHNNKGRHLVEAHHRLDASQLKRMGAFEKGYDGHLSWRGADSAPGPSVRVLGDNEAIRLSYASKGPDGSWQRREESVSLLTSPRNYGGAQTYFGCPKCGTRVKRLYVGPQRFLCRHCMNLVYASSQERSSNRALRRMGKLRRRIGAETGFEAPIGPKPKGMHSRTFDRLFGKVLDAEAEVHDDFIRVLTRLRRYEHGQPRHAGHRRFWE